VDFVFARKGSVDSVSLCFLQYLVTSVKSGLEVRQVSASTVTVFDLVSFEYLLQEGLY
jgi:hypothetical protein